jgi:hypothetical protein
LRKSPIADSEVQTIGFYRISTQPEQARPISKDDSACRRVNNANRKVALAASMLEHDKYGELWAMGGKRRHVGRTHVGKDTKHVDAKRVIRIDAHSVTKDQMADHRRH